MDRHASTTELKARAKGQLLGKYGILISAVLIIEGILMALTMMTNMFLDGSTMYGTFISYAVDFLLQLFAGIFVAGQTYMYLNVACGGRVSTGDVFYGFRSHPDKAIIIRLLPMLLMLAACAPFIVLVIIHSFKPSTLLLVAACFFLAVGLAVSTYISLRFSMAYFVMLDFPDFTAKECLRFSSDVMKGNKCRLFYLKVSFIPLYLLGFFTCCIGLLFLFPYTNTTMANFYLELMSFRDRQAKD